VCEQVHPPTLAYRLERHQSTWPGCRKKDRGMWDSIFITWEMVRAV